MHRKYYDMLGVPPDADDKTIKKGFVFSRGEDNLWNTPDDLIFDSRNNQVTKREDLGS